MIGQARSSASTQGVPGRIADPHENRGLGSEEEIALVAAYRDGAKEAEEKILVSHFPLVRAIARKLYVKNRRFVEFDDLVSAGYEGLVYALRRYDPNAGARFGTYARWWIMNKISSFIRTERWTIKIPDDVYKAVLKLMREVRQLTQIIGREPTPFEIAERMHAPVDKVHLLLVWANRHDASLNIPVGDDGTSTLADFIPEGQSPWGVGLMDQLEASSMQELREIIYNCFLVLTPLEKKILVERFGLYPGGELPVDDVSAGHGGPWCDFVGLLPGGKPPSPARVRNIERRALRKMRLATYNTPYSSATDLSPFLRQGKRQSSAATRPLNESRHAKEDIEKIEG